MKIALDIGHAGGTGARGNGLEEHEVATSITRHLAQILRNDGHTVDILDYSTLSNSDDLNTTIRQANKGNYDIGLSIHCDHADNPSAKGAHICHYTPSGLKLAQAIAPAITKLMLGRAESVVKRTSLAVLKQTRAIWVLIECGFISNPHDASIMRISPHSIAQSIAKGIANYTCS